MSTYNPFALINGEYGGMQSLDAFAAGPIAAGAAAGIGTAIVGKGIDILGEYVRQRLGMPTSIAPVGQYGSQGPLVIGTTPIRSVSTASFYGKRKRMNVCNPRALRRAIRRVKGFNKLAGKSFTFEKKVRIKKRRR